MSDLESCKDILKDELKDCPHVRDGLLGHASSYRKLARYICACIKENVLQTECIQWFDENIAKQLTNQDEIKKIKILIEGAYLYKEYSHNSK